jgi:hypothetical protein
LPVHGASLGATTLPYGSIHAPQRFVEPWLVMTQPTQYEERGDAEIDIRSRRGEIAKLHHAIRLVGVTLG